MGTSLSEPTDPGEFELAARRLAHREIEPAAVSSWSQQAKSRLLDRLYFVIRHDFMGRDQEDLREAIEVLARVLGDSDFDETTKESARLTTLRALMNRNARRYEVAKILSEDVLQRSAAAGWAELEYDAHITIADAAFQQGQPKVAERHYADALALAERLGDEVGAGRVLLNSAALKQSIGKPSESVELSTRALEYFLANDCGALAGWSLVMESNANMLIGEYGRAFESVDRAQNLFEVLEHGHGLATSYSHIGMYHHIIGELDAARDAYFKSHQLMSSSGFGDVENVEIYLGLLAIDYGKLTSGAEQLSRVEKSTSESGRLPHLFLVSAGLLHHAAALGDIERAAEYFEKVVNLSERTNYLEMLIACQLDFAAEHLADIDRELCERVRAFAADHRARLVGNKKG